MSRVTQKDSGCFRTIEYTNPCCQISSYLRSMSARGYNSRFAIQTALDGNATHELMVSGQSPSSESTPTGRSRSFDSLSGST